MESNGQALSGPMQDELFSADELPTGLELLLPEPEQQKRFTADQVALNKQRYHGIVMALGQGLSMRMICRAFTASHHTVKVIREREPELVATEKQRLSRLLGYGIRLCAEGIVEDLENGVPHWDSDGNVSYRPVPTNIKSISLGILSDKKAQLDGEATAIIRHESGKLPSLEDMKRIIDAIPAISAASKPVLEIEGPSDCGSGEREEKAA